MGRLTISTHQQQVGGRVVGRKRLRLGAAVEHRQATDHLVRVGSLVAVGGDEELVGQPDVGRHVVTERGGDERGCRDLRAGEHAAVAEHRGHTLGEDRVEHPDHDPRGRVELADHHGGVHVGHVVALDQGHRGRVGDAGPTSTSGVSRAADTSTGRRSGSPLSGARSAMSGAWSASADRTITVTGTAYVLISSLASRRASVLSPHTRNRPSVDTPAG